MALIVDASVAIKWFIDEEGSREARHLLDVEPDLQAPELLFPEVSSAAWRKARLGHIEPRQAQQVARRMARGVVRLRSHASLGERSMEMALDLDPPIYDCFYVALAEAERSQVVSADQRLVTRVAGSRWASFVRLLS